MESLVVRFFYSSGKTTWHSNVFHLHTLTPTRCFFLLLLLLFLKNEKNPVRKVMMFDAVHSSFYLRVNFVEWLRNTSCQGFMCLQTFMYIMFEWYERLTALVIYVAVGGSSERKWTCICAADGLPKVAANSYDTTCFASCTCTSGTFSFITPYRNNIFEQFNRS